MTTFNGEALRAARDTKGLSQALLGRLADVSTDTVYRAEAGLNIPSAENLARIAQVLEISLDDLFKKGEAA
jgi:transcriptional regulator with XRE-family HTH domain